MSSQDPRRLCDMIKALRIEDGVDTDQIMGNPIIAEALDSNEMSLIHLACHLGNVRLVTALLEQGADVNCKTGDGSAPIHILCSNIKDLIPNLRILELLLHNDIDLNVQDSSGQTALLLACSNELVPIVRLLIQSGCNVNIADKDGNTAFSISCRLATEGWYFWNFDYHFSGSGQLDRNDFPFLLICKDLLQTGADPRQDTLLPSAILYSSMNVVKEFIDIGMYVNSMDKNRRTPLGSACSTPSVPCSMVKFLLENGADVNEDSGGRKSKPIILAFVHNSMEKIKLLLSYGATLSPEEMSDLVSVNLSKCFLGNPEILDEDSMELLSWRLLIKAGFRSQLDMYTPKLKQIYLCSSFSKVSKILDDLIFPLHSLSDLCRISIRSQLSPSLDDNIDHLPLPSSLKKFLAFDEFRFMNEVNGPNHDL